MYYDTLDFVLVKRQYSWSYSLKMCSLLRAHWAISLWLNVTTSLTESQAGSLSWEQLISDDRPSSF